MTSPIPTPTVNVAPGRLSKGIIGSRSPLIRDHAKSYFAPENSGRFNFPYRARRRSAPQLCRTCNDFNSWAANPSISARVTDLVAPSVHQLGLAYPLGVEEFGPMGNLRNPRGRCGHRNRYIPLVRVLDTLISKRRLQRAVHASRGAPRAVGPIHPPLDCGLNRTLAHYTFVSEYDQRTLHLGPTIDRICRR
jgi:hypothetical protein